MNSDSISCHQAGVIAGFMLLVLKLTSFPSLMADCSEVGSILSLIIICLFNVGIIALIFWIKRKYNNKSLYSILSSAIGGFLTKVIYFILFVFFILKLLSLVDDGFGFIRDIADDEFTYFNFVICFFPVICALAYSGIRNLARTCEFFYPFVLIGFFVAILFSFAPISFWGVGSLSRLNLNCFTTILGDLSFWNGDLFVLLIFVDKIELKKGKIRQLFSPIIIMSIFLIISYIIYFSLYQQTSILHTNMIFDIIEYSIGTSSGWHMDIFAIIIYMVSLFLQGAIYVFSAGVAVSKIFNFHNRRITYAGIVGSIIIVQFLYLNDYLKYIVFAIDYLSIFTSVLLIAVPIMLILMILLKRREDAGNTY